MMIVMMSMMKLSYLGLNKVLPRVGIYIISLHVDQQGKTIIEGAIKSLTMSHIAFKHLRLFIGRPRYMCSLRTNSFVFRDKYEHEICLFVPWSFKSVVRLSEDLNRLYHTCMLAGIYRV